MNKMRCNKKLFLAIGILFAVALMFAVSPVSAAVSYPPAQSIQAMGVPAATTGAPGVILDNFEYWDSPQDHGWTLQHPGMPNGYPVWGVGLGVGTIENVIDFQQGSRVLEAYMPATVMVPNIQRFTISYSSPYTSVYTLDQLSVFSVKMRSPVSVETFDTFEIVIFATDGAQPASNIEFHLTPRANTNGALVPVVDPEGSAQLVSSANGTEVININVGREIADGSWHQINVDLAKAYEAATNNSLSNAQRVLGLSIIGNQYRMDDLMLVSCALNSRIGVAPYLFHINNMYQMLYDPAGTSRLVFACDPVASTIYPTQCMGGVDSSFLAACGCPDKVHPGTTDILAAITGGNMADIAAQAWVANKIPGGELDASAWSAYAGGSDLSNLNMSLTAAEYRAAVEDYETNVAGRTLGDMKVGVNGGTVLSPATPITLAIGNGGADVTLPLADLYALDIPQLVDAQMAAGPNTFDNGINRIAFTANIGGAHEQGTCTDLITNLPITTMPPYVPLYGQASLQPCCGGNANGFLTGAELGSTQIALMAAGYSVWPAIAVLNVPAGQNQIAENLVITVVASNGLAEDVEALTLITTNYPVTNYPPVIEDVDDQIFYLGMGPQHYQLNATDADSFTFSSAVQFADDMANLTWNATLNGLPTYAYGPWTDSLIDQKTGLVQFTPEFEGAYTMNVEVTDQDGAIAGAAFVIYCVNQGTWLNHPPVMLGDWDHPMIGTAGETLTLVFDGIVDPDGEGLYYSCNIGSIGVRDGNPVWEFQTSYPGNYQVEIVAYDTRGGYLVIPQEVIISPWWSN
jgi:hypothetical protein